LQTLSSRLSDKDTAVLILTLLMTPEQADYLFQFLPESDAAILGEETQRLLMTQYEQLVPLLQSELRAMLDYDYTQDVLSEVESEWLARLLQSERPHIVTRILEALPDLLRGELTSHIPKSMLLRLPKASQLPPIQQRMRQVVLAAYLRRFRAIGGGDESKTFMFRNVTNLSGEDLLAVIKEMGLTLFATAFQGVDARYLQKLSSRMPREDERELMEAVRSLGQVPPDEVKVAQKTILAMDMSSMREGWLFKKAGLKELGKCLVLEHPQMGEHLAFKLDREMGEMLLGVLDESRKQPPVELVARLKSQDFVVRCVQKLAFQERIEPKWKDCQFLLYFGA